MTLKFSTSGRPMIECINPECKKLHAIYRRGDYVQRAQTKVMCRSCGTKWALNETDKTALQNHYQQRQEEMDAKKREKEQKNRENIAKTETIQQQTNHNITGKTVKNPADKPKKNKSFIDEIFSL